MHTDIHLCFPNSMYHQIRIVIRCGVFFCGIDIEELVRAQWCRGKHFGVGTGRMMVFRWVEVWRHCLSIQSEFQSIDLIPEGALVFACCPKYDIDGEDFI